MDSWYNQEGEDWEAIRAKGSGKLSSSVYIENFNFNSPLTFFITPMTGDDKGNIICEIKEEFHEYLG